MSKKRESKTKAESKAKVELADSAHKVWLAGLGALAAAGAEGERLFHTLVRRGESVEKQVQGPVESAGAWVSETVKQARDRAGKTIDSISSTIDETVALALSRLGVPSRAEIASLAERVEKLTRAVDAKQKTVAKPRRSAAKPAPRRKAATRKTATSKAATRRTTRSRATKPQATA